MSVKILIGGNKVDLYDDEKIVVKSSIADIENIEDINTDYSQAFTVPASKSNNKTFKHYYNSFIDNTFDARKLVSGGIELNNRPFKTGKWALHKASVKNGNPSNYQINYTGNLIDLKDKIGVDKLSELDFTEYNHDYNGSNVYTGLINELFNGDIKYSLIANKQYYYNSNIEDDTDTDELTNIAFNSLNSNRGVRYSDLKPSIRVGAILDKIQSQYDIVFSDDFLGLDRIQNLYMHCSNNSGDIVSTENTVTYTSGDSPYMDNTTGVGEFPYISSNYYRKEFTVLVTPLFGYENIEYTVNINIDDVDLVSNNVSGNSNTFKYIDNNEGEVNKVLVNVVSSSEFKANIVLKQRYKSIFINNFPDLIYESTRDLIPDPFIIESEYDLSLNIPDVEIMDFLKSLFRACKLVVIPQDDGSLYVNTISEYYKQGDIYDLNKYTDTYNYDIERGELLNKITYKFSDTDTILNYQFKENTGLGYGDEFVELTDEEGNSLIGDEDEIETVFENVLYERLTDQETGENTTIGYGALIDIDRNKVDPTIFLHYIVNVSTVSNIPRFVDENGDNFTMYTLNVPSNSINLDEFETNNAPFSFLFSNEFSYYNGGLLNNNLYSNYHKAYIEGIFNIKRRNVYYKAVLPQYLIAKLKLNDVLVINGGYYRIDNTEIDLTTGEASLKLFTAYDTELLGKPESEYYVTQTTNLPYPYDYTSLKVDTGFGTDWYTITDIGSLLTFTLDENETGSTRTSQTILTNANGFESTVYITQQPKSISIDNNTITIDTNNITADNG